MKNGFVALLKGKGRNRVQFDFVVIMRVCIEKISGWFR
jgi:hypothetical protein